MNLLHEIAHSIFSWIVKVTMYEAKINLYNLDVLILSFFCHKYLIPSSSTRNSLKQTLRIGILLVLLSTDIQDLLLSKRRKYYVQWMRKHLWTIRIRIITILSLTFTVPDLSESSPIFAYYFEKPQICKMQIYLDLSILSALQFYVTIPTSNSKRNNFLKLLVFNGVIFLLF